MPFKTIQEAVGNPDGMKGLPVNLPPDVLIVKELLWKIPESEGGPSATDRPLCDPASGGVFNPMLQTLILRFQHAQRAKGVPMQGEHTAGGRVMKYSATLRELNRVASAVASPAAKADPRSYIIPVTSYPPTNWNPVPDPTPALEQPGGFGEFLQGIMGRSTAWTMSGGAGGGLGVGPIGFGGGAFSIKRPDGSEFRIVGAFINTGLSLAPLAISFGGPDTPGTNLGTVYSNFGRPPEDQDFKGGFIMLSASATVGGGLGVTIWCGGYGANIPHWSAVAALLTGPIGPTLAAFKAASVVALFAGVQYGTPDAGVSIALGHAGDPAIGPGMKPKEGVGGIYRGSL